MSGDDVLVAGILNQILLGDSLKVLQTLPDNFVNTCVTSPPYWGLRDYGTEGQIGLEDSPEQFVESLVQVFREVRRVLRDDGTLWLNLGDSYSGSGKGPAGNLGATHNERCMENTHSAIVPNGLKPKDLIGVPWKVAFALQSDGWYLRQDIIWHKPNPMPESVKDRCTKSHEYIFLLSKSSKYYFDNKAISEPSKYAGDNRGARLDSRRGTECNSMSGVTGDMRNKRSVWTVTTHPFSGAHFATFPEKLIEPCILAGSPRGGVVLDPFFGAGTTGVVCKKLHRDYVGIEINPEYKKIASDRIENVYVPVTFDDLYFSINEE